jgi:hypothetical protein
MITYADKSDAKLHRSAITAVDKLAAITIEAAKQDGVVGVMAASEHKCAVAPANAYGSAGPSAVVAVTPTLNKTVDITVPQCAGATHYDVFFSTDAAPKWVGRITEAQRASGIAITAVGTTAAGGSAGKVNVRLVGTGLGSDVAPFSTNNAYKPTAVTAVDCTGRTKALIHVKAAVTDLRSLPTLSVVPFLKNAATGEFSQGTVVALAPLSAIGKALQQSFTLDVLGASGLVVLVDTISGQGTAATVYVELM